MDDFGNSVIDFSDSINPCAYWRFHWSGKDDFLTMSDADLRLVGLISEAQ